MPLISTRDFSSWLTASVSLGLQINHDGSLELARTNPWPNQYGQTFGPDGEPVGWDIESGMPERIVGHDVLLSTLGAKPSTVTRQTTSLIPLSQDYWDGNQPIVPGVRPLGKEGPKPETPQAFAIADPTKGFIAGNYGFAYAYSAASLNYHGPWKPTTPSGTVFFSVGNSQSIEVPVPTDAPAGAKYVVFYLTPPNGSRLALQRVVALDQLRGRETFTLQGPWTNGQPPATVNDSGLGTPPAPRVTGPARYRDIWQLPSVFDLWAARYRFALQLENERGETLISHVSPEVEVKGDVIRELVKEKTDGSDAPSLADVGVDASVVEVPASAAATVASAAVPPTLRPPGKRNGDPDEYEGQELDFEESRLIALINERRREVGVPDLIVSQVMNRAAYRKATGNGWPPTRLARDEGYEGDSLYSRIVSGGTPNAAFAELEDIEGPELRSVGVARENSEWVVFAGEPIIDPDYDVAELVCEEVGPDGTVVRHSLSGDDVRAAISLSWSLVNNNFMRYSYAGSYGTHVSSAASKWHALGVVKVTTGGQECAVTDGSLELGVYGRTYSDGRMILNSYYFNMGTANANATCTVHEFGHAMGFGHLTDPPSVMYPSINTGRTDNYENLTTYDTSEYKRVYGEPAVAPTPTEPTPTDPAPAPAPAPAPTPAPVPLQPQQPQPAPQPKQPEYRYSWKTRVLPYKRKTCFYWRVPSLPSLRRGARWRPWVEINGEWHRAYPKSSRTGDDVGFTSRSGQVRIHGYPPDEEPRGLQVGLVQEDPPEEDTTVLEAPGASTIPDTPEATGSVLPSAGRYLAGVQGVLEGGGRTAPSDFVPVALGANQFPRIRPAKTVNRLYNAEWAQKNAAGVPLGWQPVGFTAGVTTWDADEGTLSLGTAVPTNTTPQFPSEPEPINRAQDVVTVGCRLSMDRYISGQGLVLVRQLDAAGAITAETIVATLSATGAVELSRTFGPGYTEWAAETASYQIVPRIQLGGATQADLDMRVSYLQAVGFPTLLRRYEMRAGGPAASDVLPDTPLAGSSFAAIGPAPTPAGATVVQAEPPLSLLSFETAFPSTGTYEGWTRGGNASAGISAVNTTARIHNSMGWQIRDSSTTASVTTFLSRTFTNSPSSSLRWLHRFIQAPNYGEAEIARVYSQGSGNILAILRQRADKTLWIYAFRPELGRYVRYQMTGAIPNGSTQDLQISVAGGGTKNGVIAFSMSAFGQPRRLISLIGGINYSGYLPNTHMIGLPAQTDPRANIHYYIDQVVSTRNGDVLTRETPAQPVGQVAPLPDAPQKPPVAPATVGTPRLLDEDGNAINQLYIFLASGHSPASNPARIPLLEDPMPVKPGLSYTIAALGRYVVFTPEAAPGLKVTLVGPGMEPLEVGSVHGNGMAGTRGWIDDALTFSVPAIGEDGSAYTGAKVELVLHDGVYVLQEFLMGEGVLTTPEARDAKRGYGRATNGEATKILPAHPPHDLGLAGGTFWTRLGAKESGGSPLPAGVGLDFNFSSGHDLSYAFSTETPDPEIVPHDTFARVRATFTGNGRDSAVLPSGGAFLETWHPIGTLLREDRSSLPGSVLIANVVYPVSYPDAETERVAGHLYTAETTEDIGRSLGLTLLTYTEDAAVELQNRCLRDEFVLEVPGAGNRVAGQALRIKFAEQLEPDIKEASTAVIDVQGVERREIYAVFSADEVEVLEVAPLLGPDDALRSATVGSA